MKVLFAVNDEKDAEAITRVYQKEYKEIISSKTVYYFNAIIKELQKDKTYDRIVISEDVEMFASDNYQAVDKFIFDKMDAISDEATNTEGNDIPIILLGMDRRTKNDPLLVKLFGLGLYNVLVGQDRSLQKVAALMYKPRTKKEAKAYYKVEAEKVTYSADNKNGGVSESEIQNILTHYKKIGDNIPKCVQSFDSIVSQYSKEQVKLIIQVLPNNVKVILEENSDAYRKIMGIKGKKAEGTSQLRKTEYVEKEIDTGNRLTQPVIIPTAVGSKKVPKMQLKTDAAKKKRLEEIENKKLEEEKRIAKEKAEAEAKRKEEERLAKLKAEEEAKKKEEERLAKLKAEAEAKRKEEERLARLKAEAEAKKKEEERLAKLKAEEESEVVTTVKRGRGRPRKTPVEAVVLEDVPVKRKRGRPRKNPIIEDVQDKVEEVKKEIVDAEDVVTNKVSKGTKAVKEVAAKKEEAAKNDFDEFDDILAGFEDYEDDVQDVKENVSYDNDIDKKVEDDEFDYDLLDDEDAEDAYDSIDKDVEDDEFDYDSIDDQEENNSENNSSVEDEDEFDYDLLDEEDDDFDYSSLDEEDDDDYDFDSIDEDDAETEPETEYEKEVEDENFENEDVEDDDFDYDLLDDEEETNNDTQENEEDDDFDLDWEDYDDDELEPEPEQETQSFDEDEDEDVLPGFEDEEFDDKFDEDDNVEDTDAETQDNNDENLGTDDFEDDDVLPGFDDDDDYNFDDEDDSNNVEEVVEEPETHSPVSPIQHNGAFKGISNKNYKYDNDLANSIKDLKETEENTSYNLETDNLITSGKKIVSFVGTTKNGTSFIVNNLAELYSNRGIKTAILDLTKNKNSYYIYTNNEDELRDKAQNCLDKLRDGMADGVVVNKNLSVFTSLPGQDDALDDVTGIIKTLLENYTIVLLDCDFDTDVRYFRTAQEMYLVQSLDVLTIQPLTAFLRDLKVKDILETNKLRVIINKNIKVNALSEKVLIGGMSVYNDPAMTYMTELFNKETIKYTTVPFEDQVYVKYLEGLVNCQISSKGYSKNFISSLNKLADMVYPTISGKNAKNYNDYSNNNKKFEDAFSKNTSSILNKMKKKY